MSQQSFEVAFFTIGEFEGLSADDTTRTAHIDVPTDCLSVAAALQSARQWLNEQHAHIDMECAAELPVRGYFSFKGANGRRLCGARQPGQRGECGKRFDCACLVIKICIQYGASAFYISASSYISYKNP
jgi:hypothetical protein